MPLTTRMSLILTLSLAIAAGAFAQEETSTAASTTSTAATETAATETTATETTTAGTGEVAEDPVVARDVSSYEKRNMFTRLLQRHQSELWMILKLDPNLLANESWLAGYPELKTFVEKNPEIRLNPRFYLAEFPTPGRDESVADEIFEALAVAFSFCLAAFALGWFIRTLIEQRRWSRLSKQQAEVHNKILDRFSTSQEVLEYIKTPAGTKFLESAPIPLHAEKPVRSSPFSRVLWTIQLGIILGVAGFGMLLVSFRFSGESSEAFFALGAIGFCIGAGFIASALVSLVMARRLAAWQAENAAVPPLDDTGLVR